MGVGTKRGWMCPYEWTEPFRQLPDDQAGALMKYLMVYASTGEKQADLLECESGSDVPKALASFMPGIIEANQEAYREKCRRNQENGKKGGRPKQVSPEAGETERF